jgi:hypothetical protein
MAGFGVADTSARLHRGALALRLNSARAEQGLREREVCVYSISCKSQNNIDLTLDWLTKHAKS